MIYSLNMIEEEYIYSILKYLDQTKYNINDIILQYINTQWTLDQLKEYVQSEGELPPLETCNYPVETLIGIKMSKIFEINMNTQQIEVTKRLTNAAKWLQKDITSEWINNLIENALQDIEDIKSLNFDDSPEEYFENIVYKILTYVSDKELHRIISDQVNKRDDRYRPF